MKTAIWWVREDFRLTDQPFLHQLSSEFDFLIPIVLDLPIKNSKFGFSTIGEHRLRFREESIQALESNLKRLGSGVKWFEHSNIDLALRTLLPFCPNPVLFYRDIPTTYEQKEVKQIASLPLKAVSYCDNLLWTEDQLPFSLDKLPLHFTPFRHKVESANPSVFCSQAPTTLPPLPPGIILQDALPHRESNSQPHFRGGEPEGIQRVNYYLWESHAIRTYKETRNGLALPNDSSRFSIWLSSGCLSVRWIWTEIVRYESEYGSNDSTYWLKFELLWREFFKWTERRYGNRIFQLSGLGNKSASDCFSPEIFQSWINGTTGDELTDAVMRELRATGYTSNRGRQNAASYLIHDLGQDWRSGAAWFERQLIDYDPASNFGNWGYIAGVGTDPRGGRKFNTIQQASNYDPDGAFRSFWLKPMDSVDSGT